MFIAFIAAVCMVVKLMKRFVQFTKNVASCEKIKFNEYTFHKPSQSGIWDFPGPLPILIYLPLRAKGFAGTGNGTVNVSQSLTVEIL